MNINYELLKQVCLADESDFESLGTVTNTKDGPYIYRNNPDAKILGIAHLDTVLDMEHFYQFNVNGDEIILNAQLDDRLGVYTLLDVLPKLGIQFDLLLTVGEETGRSTAKHFKSTKDYNWMFSFDRHGDDVVMYQYDNSELRNRLIKAGLRPSYGSFSDIAFLSHLGICGINIGTGYEGEHDDMCYANMTTLCQQIERFKTFYELYEDTKIPYVPSAKKITSSKVSSYTSYTDYLASDRHIFETKPYDDFYCYLCDKHPGKHQIMNDVWLCDACFNDAGQCATCQEIVYQDELIDGICEECQP